MEGVTPFKALLERVMKSSVSATVLMHYGGWATEKRLKEQRELDEGTRRDPSGIAADPVSEIAYSSSFAGVRWMVTNRYPVSGSLALTGPRNSYACC